MLIYEIAADNVRAKATLEEGTRTIHFTTEIAGAATALWWDTGQPEPTPEALAAMGMPALAACLTACGIAVVGPALTGCLEQAREQGTPITDCLRGRGIETLAEAAGCLATCMMAAA